MEENYKTHRQSRIEEKLLACYASEIASIITALVMKNCNGCIIESLSNMRVASLRVASLRVASLRVASLRVCELRVCELRVCELRVCELRVCELRVCELRVCELRVCELRVCEFTVGIYCLENAHLSVILCALTN